MVGMMGMDIIVQVTTEIFLICVHNLKCNHKCICHLSIIINVNYINFSLFKILMNVIRTRTIVTAMRHATTG